MSQKNTLERSLHLVDLENLSGGSTCSIEGISATAADYLETGCATQIDQFVIATSCNNGPASCFGWPTSAQRLMRSGENGADLALLDAYEPSEITSRFRSVVIGSGDGIFAPLAAALAKAGCHVTVVTRPESLSNRLRLAAGTIVFLPTMIDDGGVSHAA